MKMSQGKFSEIFWIFILHVTKLAYLRFYNVTKIISETETVSFKLRQTKLISVYLFLLITVTIQYICPQLKVCYCYVNTLYCTASTQTVPRKERNAARSKRANWKRSRRLLC
jgi:hypothetical protein